MAARGEEVIPRPIIALLLVLIAIVGAVEATPKEVAVSISTEPLSASPLNTLPTGTSLLMSELARMGYDVRVYADVSDLLVDSPSRVVVVVVAPERVARAHVNLLASYAASTEYFGVVLADERMHESGSLALLTRLLRLCGVQARPGEGPSLETAVGALYLNGYGESPVTLLPLATAATVTLGGGLDVPPFTGNASTPPAPPYIYERQNAKLSVYGFIYAANAWRPLSYVIECPGGGMKLAVVGDGDFTRNYMVNASRNYLAHSLTLIESVAGPPSEGVTVAFIVSFYIGKSLKLSTVLHPSFLLSLIGQIYAAFEPTVLNSLTPKQAAILLAALSLAAGMAVAGYMAGVRRFRRPLEGEKRGPGRIEVLGAVKSLCLSRGLPRVYCSRLAQPGFLARVTYTLLGWERYYLRVLRKLGGGS